MEIAKDKISSNLLVLETGDAKNTPFSYSVIAQDLVGLTWVFKDNSTSHFADNKRRC